MAASRDDIKFLSNPNIGQQRKKYCRYRKFGIKKVETNPELETNIQVQAIWKDYSPRQHKRRRCFIKNL